MSIVTADELREHSNLSDEDSDEFLEQKIAAAEDWCAAIVGQALTEFDPLPAAVKEAVLRISADLYENREATAPNSMSALPIGVAELLAQHRNWAF